MNPLRTIPYSERGASLNMALDWVLLHNVLEGAVPCLRFYAFRPPSVTIGKFQNGIPRSLEAYPCARRPTGGRAVLHDGDLIFSLSGKHTAGYFSGSVLETYRLTAEILAEAAQRLGVPVEVERGSPQPYDEMCFRSTSRYEITLDGRKVVGIAQAREKDAFLEQGSMYVPVDRWLYMEEIKRVLCEKGFEIVEEDFTPEELKRAEEAQKEFEVK
ncbi:MAG: lipoate--protein ligase family protein [candidate division WOR-3 bacterium]